MSNLKFPESFAHSKHRVVKGAYQWMVTKDNGTQISIVGGPGLYGDGQTTFEVWDFDWDFPLGWQTKEEINSYLETL